MPVEPTLGQIMPVAFTNNLPRGWAVCDGSLLPISGFQALFSLIGTTYGGDGRTNFALPDLRGRAIVGSAERNGKKQGSTTVALTDQQLPNHNHTWAASTTAGAGRGSTPSNNLFGVNTSGSQPTEAFALSGSMEVALASGTNVADAGAGAPHNNMQPYLTINYIIATNGIMPSRL